jgi:hypothetical protein
VTIRLAHLDNRPLLTLPQVLLITDLTAPTLQTWVQRGQIKPPQQSPGRGKSRLYSKANCIVGAILRRTMGLNLPISLGVDLSSSVIEDYSDRAIPSDLVVFLDEQNIWLSNAASSSPRLYRFRWTYESESKTTVRAALKASNGDPVVIFPLGKIIERTGLQIADEIFSDSTQTESDE